MKIELELNYLDGSVDEAILDRAAAQALDTIDRDVRARLTKRIGDVLTEEIKDRVVPLVEAALAEPFQPTDEWGGSRGKPQSIREVVMELIRRELKVSERSSITPTTAERFLRSEIQSAINKELKDALEAAKAQVRDAVANGIGEAVARKLGS